MYRVAPLLCAFAAVLLISAGTAGRASGQTGGSDAAELARAASAHADGGRLDLAMTTAAAAERIATAQRNHTVLADVERARAVVSRFRGAHLQAIEHARAAVRHAQRAADGRAMSAAFTQLAAGYQEIGDWERALDSARQAFESHPAPTELTRAQYLMQRGIVLHEMREGAEALASFEEALGLSRKIDNPRMTAFALLEIGLSLWLIEGRPADAISYFEDADTWARSAGAVSLQPPNFSNWGGALRDLGRYDEAIDRFRHGLDIRPGGQPTGSAPTLTKNLGQTLALAGRPAEAEPILLEGVALADRMNTPNARWQARMELGLLLSRRDPERADRFFAESIELLEKQTGNALLETFRAGVFGHWLNKYDPFDRYIDFLLDRGETDRAFAVAERARARAFLDVLSAAREQLARVIPAEFARQENELLAEISQLQAGLRTPEQPAGERAQRMRRVAAAEDRLGALRLRLAAERPALAHARYPRLWSAREFSSDVLAADEYLVMFYVGRERTTCWIVSRAGVSVARLPSRAALTPLVRAYLDALKSPASRLEEPARALGAALSPALNALPAGARLVIVPHAILNYLPFEALLAEDGTFLAERHAVSYSPSASSVAFLRQAPPTSPGRRPVLAIGNPAAAAPGTASATRKDATLRQVAYLKPLVWAGHELREIAAIFGSNARVLQGREATEAALAGAGLEQASVLHFATHGLIDEDKPERSALALSPRPPLDDGILQVREIYRWRLRATLVTLSACETALGRDVTGEGLVGLSRAFFAAGATAVTASLWSVDDASTAEYMRHFYGALHDGARIDDAARGARRGMIAAGGRFSHPYYWAAFVVTGNAAGRVDLPPQRALTAAPFMWLALALTGAAVIVWTRRRV